MTFFVVSVLFFFILVFTYFVILCKYFTFVAKVRNNDEYDVKSMIMKYIDFTNISVLRVFQQWYKRVSRQSETLRRTSLQSSSYTFILIKCWKIVTKTNETEEFTMSSSFQHWPLGYFRYYLCFFCVFKCLLTMIGESANAELLNIRKLTFHSVWFSASVWQNINNVDSLSLRA